MSDIWGNYDPPEIDFPPFDNKLLTIIEHFKRKKEQVPPRQHFAIQQEMDEAIYQYKKRKRELRTFTDNQETSKRPDAETKQPPATADWYIKSTGYGSIRGKQFRLKAGLSPYLLFNALVATRYLDKSKTLSILNLDAHGADKTVDSYSLNETIKQIRKTTSLTKKELIINGGNITLNYPLEIKEAPNSP